MQGLIQRNRSGHDPRRADVDGRASFLIQVKAGPAGLCCSADTDFRRTPMPAETIIILTGVTAAFSIFGGLLAWATSIAGPAFPGYGRSQAPQPRTPGIGPAVLAR
jgi:hypothetical protein